jgi:hypothetical protein
MTDHWSQAFYFEETVVGIVEPSLRLNQNVIVKVF